MLERKVRWEEVGLAVSFALIAGGVIHLWDASARRDRVPAAFTPSGQAFLPTTPLEPGTAVTEDGRIIKTLPPAKVPKISVFMSDQVSLSELRAEVADLRKSTEEPLPVPTRKPTKDPIIARPAPAEKSTPEPPPGPNAEWELVPDGSGGFHITALGADPCPWVGPVADADIRLVPIDPTNPVESYLLGQTRISCWKNAQGVVELKSVYRYVLATPTP